MTSPNTPQTEQAPEATPEPTLRQLVDRWLAADNKQADASANIAKLNIATVAQKALAAEADAEKQAAADAIRAALTADS